MPVLRRLGAAAAIALAAAVVAPAPASAQSDAAALLLDRLADYEAELRRLTARVEELERRLAEERRAAEARIDDLESRVLILEGGDPMAVFDTPTSDGDAAETDTRGDELRGDGEAAEAGRAADPPPARSGDAGAASDGPGAPPRPLGALRVEPEGEGRAAFEAAMRDLERLGPSAGRDSVERFASSGPSPSLGAEAWGRLGRALLDEGRDDEAARAFYRGLRDFPGGPGDAANLLGLGEALSALGRDDQACGAFAEIARNHPDAPSSIRDRAAEAARRAGCS